MAQAVCTEDPAAEMAWRAHAERTLNMAAMVVTLEMSKLSGWLNAAALCRVEREAWDEEHIVGLTGHAQSALQTCWPWL